jgi:hypothetical protein
MARVMPRAFLSLSAAICLGWLTLISKVQHGPWRVTGTTAQRATEGWPHSHCERVGLCPACRKQRFMDQVVRARGVTYAAPSIQIERQRFSV